MDEPEPNEDARRRFRSRVFLVVFFGLAVLISITTILGTWRQLDETTPAASPPAAATDP